MILSTIIIIIIINIYIYIYIYIFTGIYFDKYGYIVTWCFETLYICPQASAIVCLLPVLFTKDKLIKSCGFNMELSMLQHINRLIQSHVTLLNEAEHIFWLKVDSLV
jgi:hypothetical protein